MNTKALRQKILDLAIHGKLIRNEELGNRNFPQISQMNADSAADHHTELVSASISEDEIPFELPKGWAWKRLPEVCEIPIKDGTHKTPTYTDKEHGIPFLSSKDVTSQKIDWTNIKYITKDLHEELYKRIAPQKNDILLAKNGTTGVAAIVDTDVIFDIYVTLAVIRPNCSKIYPKYLLSIINSQFCKNQFNEHLTGIGVPNLHLNDINKTFIPVPPLAEQKLIVAKIEKIFAQIDLLEQNKTDLLTAIKQSKSKILDLAIHGKLVPQDPSDEPVSALLERLTTSDNRPYEKMEEPFAIPESWAWCRLGEIYSHTTGKALKKSNQKGTLRKYITTSNLYWNNFDFTDVRSMYFTDEELDKCTAKKGDLLVCNGGDVGRAAIWNFDYDICYQNHISRLRPKTDEIDNKFYFYVIWLNKEKGNLNGKGIGITSLSASDLLSMLIPLPPLAEQQRIVSKIEKLFSALDSISKNLE